MTSMRSRIDAVEDVLSRSIYLELGHDIAYGFDFENLAEEVLTALDELEK